MTLNKEGFVISYARPALKVILCVLFCGGFKAQAIESSLVYSGPSFNPNNLIVKFKNPKILSVGNLKTNKKNKLVNQIEKLGVSLDQILIESMGIYLMHPHKNLDKNIFQIKKELETMSEVEFVQLDYHLQERSASNFLLRKLSLMMNCLLSSGL